MKIRIGFVSNSSSSSFLIYGFEMDGENVLDLFNKMKKDGSIKQEEVDELEFDDCCEEDEKEYYPDQIAELVGEKIGLEATCDCERDDYYFGLSWDSIGDNETGKQFKDKIDKIVEKINEKYQINADARTLDEVIQG